jgi:hypothetical protein
MEKLLLMSVVFASVAIPAWAAHLSDPRRGLRLSIVGMAIFMVVYMFGLFVVWPRIA